MIGIDAVSNHGQITRCVERRTITLLQHKRWKICVRTKLDDQCALFSDLKYLLLFSFFQNWLHLVLIETFASLHIHMDLQPLIHSIEGCMRHSNHVLPEGAQLFVSFFQLHKCGACFVFQFWMCLHLLVETDIELQELVDGMILRRFGSPAFHRHGQLAELRPPITQIIPSDDMLTLMTVDIDDGLTDDRRQNMMNTQWFCYVRSTVINDHRLFLLRCHLRSLCFEA